MTIETLADIALIEAVPFAERDWERDTYALLARAAARFGDEPALTWLPDATALDRTTMWSFRQLFEDVTRAANVFHTLGCGPDDVIAYLLPNLPQTHFVLWGAEATGIAFAINPGLSVDMVIALLCAMRPKLLVTAPDHLGENLRVGLASQVATVPGLEAVLRVQGGNWSPAGVTVHDFDAGMAAQSGGALLSGRAIAPDDRSSAFCTGGTTGAPKIAVRTHGAEAADAAMLGTVIASQIGQGARAFCGLPLFHVNATLVTGLACWINGAHVVLGPAAGYRDRALVANFWRVVEHLRIAFFSGVPTLYSTLLDVPVDGADLSSLRVGLCGAAPMPVELFRRFEDTTGIRILEGYGLTETVCTATLNPIDGRRAVGSIGLRLPYQDIRIVELDGGGALIRICETDGVGTIAIAGPNIFAGYVDPVHNESAWVEMGDGRKWLNSGDLGRIDSDGYLWLTGRRKELIIRGGHNIDPKLIEEAMHRHPDVALAAAIGRPDAHSGEVPVVYVELRDGATADAAALAAFAAREVPERAAVPKEVVILERLPTTGVGKLFKPALTLIEVERTVTGLARELGVTLHELRVFQHPQIGPAVEIGVDDVRADFEAALGRYAFASRIDVRNSKDSEEIKL